MPEKTLCHGCIGDTVLSAEVRTTGFKARCYYCGRSRKAWPLTRLAERIHRVIQANYHIIHAGPYDHYAFESSGEDPAFTITELASLDDTNIGEDIRVILSDRYGYSAQYDGGDDPYADDVIDRLHQILRRGQQGNMARPTREDSRWRKEPGVRDGIGDDRLCRIREKRDRR